jgi:hypothetical protein
MTTNPYAPPTAIVADVDLRQVDGAQPPFFPVSILKLVVLSICTFGLYELYWFYKNWQAIKARERIDISPAPRAIFAVFYCYQCFARIRDFDTPTLASSKLAAGPLAIGWVVVTLLHKLPSSYWLVSMFAVAFFIPVQMCANRINTSVSPEHHPNARFTAWNWLGVALGSIWLALALVGSFAEPQ